MKCIVPLVLFLSHITSAVARPLFAQIVEELDSSYDFIIIGGGLSGLTVADRLTENPSSKSHSQKVSSYRAKILTTIAQPQYS